MIRPRYRRRVDVTKLNPYDAHDMEIINREWRRMQARKDRRYGWLRVIAVIATYLALGCAALGCVAIILTAFRLLFG